MSGTLHPPASKPNTGPRIKWTTKKRLVLCLLKKHYNKPKDMQTLFSTIFEDELQDAGFSDQMFSRLKAQLGDMSSSRNPDVRIIWKTVFEKPVNPSLRNEHRAALKEVTEIAKRIGIKRKPAKPRPRRKSGRRVKQQNAKFMSKNRNSNLSTTYDASSVINADDLWRIIKLCCLCKEIPLLLFRCYTPKSQGQNGADGFKAQLFLDSARLTDELTGKQFFSFAKIHLNREKTEASPFISCTDSFVWALCMALQDPMNSRIAVIVPVQRELSAPVWHARPIYSALKQNFMVGSKDVKNKFYKGTAEYLVWKEIPSAAITADLSVSDILRACEQYGPLAELLHIKELGSKETGLLQVLDGIKPPPACKDVGFGVGLFAQMICGNLCKNHGLRFALAKAAGKCFHTSYSTIVSAWRRDKDFWQGFEDGCDTNPFDSSNKMLDDDSDRSTVDGEEYLAEHIMEGL